MEYIIQFIDGSTKVAWGKKTLVLVHLLDRTYFPFFSCFV